MLTWLAIGLAVVAWFWLQIVRANRDQRALAKRVERFLAGLGVSNVSVKYSGAYGWPGYAVTFGSLSEQQAFSSSPKRELLLQELSSMHGTEERGGQTFDPRMALMLLPVERIAK